jgi:hypothetical protein
VKLLTGTLLTIAAIVGAFLVIGLAAGPKDDAQTKEAMARECGKIGAAVSSRPGRTGGADNAADAMERCAREHGYKLNLRDRSKYENP